MIITIRNEKQIIFDINSNIYPIKIDSKNKKTHGYEGKSINHNSKFSKSCVSRKKNMSQSKASCP